MHRISSFQPTQVLSSFCLGLKLFLFGLLSLLLCPPVNAYITTGGTCTASTWDTATYYGNNGSYASGLVDGYFITAPVILSGQPTRGMPNTKNTAINQWLSVQLQNSAVIETVLLMMREDYGAATNNNPTCEIYVGATTSSLVACGANPNGSGIYFCSGRTGLHIRIQQKATSINVGVGEVRAYSVAPTPIAEFTFSSSAFTTPGCTDNLFNWPSNPQGNPSGPYMRKYGGCRQFLSGGSPAYYQVDFNQSRFVQVITLVGTDFNVFKYGWNWEVLVLVNGVYTVYGKFVEEIDNCGKEIPVGLSTTSFRIERKDGQPLGFFWVGIFSTLTPCTGAMDWTQSSSTQVMNLSVAGQTTTYIARATFGAYYVSHTMTQLDCNLLPTYVTYNASQTATVTTPANTQVILRLIATANVSYDACFKSERFHLTFNICTVTQTATPNPFAPAALEIQGLALSIQLPTITPAVNTIVYTLLNAPSFFSVSGSNLLIDSTAIAATYNFQVTTQDLVCTMTINAVVTLYDCRPTGFALSPANVSVELNKPSQTVIWQANAACGTYQVTSPLPPFIQVIGQTISVLTSTAVTQTVSLTLERVGNPLMTGAVSLNVHVYDCTPTGFVLSTSSITIPINSSSNTLTWSMNTMEPACGTYSVTTDTPSKISTASQQTLVVQNSVAESYTSTVILTRDAAPTMTNQTTLSVNIVACLATQLAFTQLAEYTEIKVGINKQPFSIPFAVDLPCNNPATFIPVNFPSFAKVEELSTPMNQFGTPSSSKGNVIVANATANMHGVYQLKLTATASTQTLEKDFSIFINGCPSSKFVSQALPSEDIFKQSGLTTGNFQFSEFEHTLGLLGINCGQTVYKLRLATGKPTPSWISLDLQKKLVKYDIPYEDKAVGIYGFELEASLLQFPNVKLSAPFYINLVSSETICNYVPPATYRLGDPLQTFALSSSKQTFAAGKKLTKVVQPEFKRDGSIIPQPKFVQYFDGIFEIVSQNFNDVGKYELGLRIGYQEIPRFEVLCQLPLSVVYEPIFEGDQVIDHTVSCDKPWSMVIPKYTDFEKRPAKLAVNLGDADSLFKFDSTNNTIDSEPAKLDGISQTYPVSMILTDSHNFSATVQFDLVVSCRVFAQNTTVSGTFKKQQLAAPRPAISSISSSGLIRVIFSRKIVLPSYELYPELKQAACEDACGRRLNVTSKEEQAIDFINTAQMDIDGTISRIIELEVVPGEFSNIKNLNFTWTCTNFTAETLNLLLIFSQVEYVSMFTERDSIIVHYNGYKYFRSEDGQTFPYDSYSKRSLIPQMSKKLAAALYFITQTAVVASKTIIVLQFIFKLILSQSLQQMFGAINKLQILTHLPLLNIAVSSNAWTFCASLVSLVNFVFYDFGPITSRVLHFKDDHPFSEEFEDYGYASKYFIINLGNLLYAFFSLLIGLLLMLCLNRASNPRLLKLRDKLRRSLIWGSFIEYFDEACLPMALSCLIAQSMWSIKNFGTAVDQIFSSCGILVIFIAVPLFKLVYLQYKRRDLHTQEFEEKFDTLTEKLSFKKTRWALVEPFLSDFRRLMLAMTIICLKRYPTFQLLSVYCQIFAVTIFNSQVEPFADRATQRQEQLNELAISWVFYHFICFATLVNEPITRMFIGWSMIGTALGCLSINFGLVLYNQVRETINAVKRFFLRRKQARWLERRRLIDEGRQKQLFAYYEDQMKEKIAAEQRRILSSVSSISLAEIEEQEEVESTPSLLIEAQFKKDHEIIEEVESSEQLPKDISGFTFRRPSEKLKKSPLLPVETQQRSLVARNQDEQIINYLNNLAPSKPMQTDYKFTEEEQKTIQTLIARKI